VLYPFLTLCIAYKVWFLSSLIRKLHCRLWADKHSKTSDDFSLEISFSLNHFTKMTSRPLYQFALFARQSRKYIRFQSTDHCIMCCTCFSVRCWVLHDIDHMEATWLFYVKVRGFNQLEEITISSSAVISFRIANLTTHYDLVVLVYFVKYHRNVFSPPLPDIVLLKNSLFISMNHEISAVSYFNVSQPTNPQTTLVSLHANHSTVGNTSKCQLYAAG
jgi:hypothetical protein